MADEIEQKTDPVDLTDEQFEIQLRKRFNVNSAADLIRKEDQIKVLTPEEKAAEEEKRNVDAMKYALDNRIFTPAQQEEYFAVKNSDPIDVLRKAYIEQHPEDKKAGNTFDRIHRLNEDDEFEDGETKVPNEEKMLAKAYLERQAQDYIDRKYGNIKKAPERYEQYLAEQKLVEKNTKLVAEAIGEVPKTIEIKTGRDTYNIPITAEDFADANKMVAESGLLKQKSIDKAEVKDNVLLHIRAKRMDEIIAEIEKVAVERAVEAVERGKSGVEVIRQTAPDGNATAFEAFNKKMGIET